MKKAIGILLTLAIVGVIANDVYRFSMDQKHVNSVTYELAEWAQKNSSVQTRDQAATALVASAARAGIEVTGYDQVGNQVTLTTRQVCDGTIVLGAVMNMFGGTKFKEAWDTPFYVKNRRQMGFKV